MHPGILYESFSILMPYAGFGARVSIQDNLLVVNGLFTLHKEAVDALLALGWQHDRMNGVFSIEIQ